MEEALLITAKSPRRPTAAFSRIEELFLDLALFFASSRTVRAKELNAS
jgi:hypothetical protein